MKFGREFETQMVQEWREAYMDYHSLKSIIKQILRFRRQKQQRPHNNPPPPPPSGETVPPQKDGGETGSGGTGGTGLSRRVSLYRAFSGLTNRASRSPKKSHKHHNPLTSKRHHHHHLHLFDDDDEQIILINEDDTGSYTTTFLNSAEEGGEMEVQFFRRLDGEFNKVLRFYKQKVENVMEEADELSRQLNVLIALRVKVENPHVHLPHDINSISSAPSSPHTRTPAASPMDVIKEMEQTEDKKAFKPAPVEMLDHIKLKIEPETPLSTLKLMIRGLPSEQTFSKPELKRAEELMNRAFIEFYQKLRVLKSYW